MSSRHARVRLSRQQAGILATSLVAVALLVAVAVGAAHVGRRPTAATVPPAATTVPAAAEESPTGAPAPAAPSPTVAPRTSPPATASPRAAQTTRAASRARTRTTAPAPVKTRKTAPAVVGTGTCGASYYDEPQGTANGETFDPEALTAAHKTLAFDTRVRVTNPANGKSVVVRINDRGPYVDGRCLDLSRAAFRAIAPLDLGALTVRYEVLAPSS